MKKMKKLQITYKTNAYYRKSREKLLMHPFVVCGESTKGHLYFHFKGFKSQMQLTKKHLIVMWVEQEKEKLYPLLKQLLVTEDDQPAEIIPKSKNIYSIPYPPSPIPIIKNGIKIGSITGTTSSNNDICLLTVGTITIGSILGGLY
jgi:hypothetical protein